VVAWCTENIWDYLRKVTSTTLPTSDSYVNAVNAAEIDSFSRPNTGDGTSHFAPFQGTLEMSAQTPDYHNPDELRGGSSLP
jgi:hypothetical protein